MELYNVTSEQSVKGYYKPTIPLIVSFYCTLLYSCTVCKKLLRANCGLITQYYMYMTPGQMVQCTMYYGRPKAMYFIRTMMPDLFGERYGTLLLFIIKIVHEVQI